MDLLAVVNGTTTVDAWQLFVEPRDPWQDAEWVGGFNEMRSEVQIPSGNKGGRYTLLFSAVGCGEVYVNGQQPEGAGLMNPGWASIPEVAVLYDAYDVTDLLHLGADGAANVVGTRVGKCKWGYRGWNCAAGSEIACNAVAWELHGPQGLVAASKASTTQGHTGPIVFDDLYFGETFDASKLEPGWNEPGFKPSTPWATARTMKPGVAGFRVSIAPPMQLGDAMPPVSVRKSPVAGAWVVDVGVNIAGLCTLTVPADTLKALGFEAGSQLRMLHGELLNADGSVRNQFSKPGCALDAVNCANQTDVYIVSESDLTNGVQYTPSFTYHGFRRVSLQGWPHEAPVAPDNSTVTCHTLHNDVQPTSSFAAGAATAHPVTHSDPAIKLRTHLQRRSQPMVQSESSDAAASVLNAIEASIRVTQTNVLQAHPADCPSREKRAMHGQTMSKPPSPEAVRFFDMSALYRNWLRAHRDQQVFGCSDPPQTSPAATHWLHTTLTDNYLCCANVSRFGCNARGQHDPANSTGFVPDVVPFPWAPIGGWPGDPSWMFASVAIPYEVYTAYGSKQALRDNFPLVSDLLDALARPENYDSRGVVTYSFYGDWLALDKVADSTLVGTASILESFAEGVSIASTLGESAAQQRWIQAGATLLRSFGAAYRGSDGTYGNGTGVQTANCLAYLQHAAGAGPFGNDTGTVAAALLNDVHKRGGALSVGVVGSRWLLECLESMGRGDVATALATRSAAPSWGYFVSDSTFPGTLWEQWENPAGGFSFDHIMFGGGIGLWIHEHAAGIRVSHGVEASEAREAVAAVAYGRTTAADATASLRQLAASRPRTRLALTPHGAALRALGSVRAHRDTPLGRVGVRWTVQQDTHASTAPEVVVGAEVTVPPAACISAGSVRAATLVADPVSLRHLLPSSHRLAGRIAVQVQEGETGALVASAATMTASEVSLPCGSSTWLISVRGEE